MERINGRTCISYDELTRITTAVNIKNLLHRGQLKQVRRACYGVTALYEVDSLPWR